MISPQVLLLVLQHLSYQTCLIWEASNSLFDDIYDDCLSNIKGKITLRWPFTNSTVMNDILSWTNRKITSFLIGSFLYTIFHHILLNVVEKMWVLHYRAIIVHFIVLWALREFIFLWENWNEGVWVVRRKGSCRG